MGYLITQILIYLVLAAIIGFLMAWVLRGTRLGARIEELENELWDLRQRAGGQTNAGDASALAELRSQLASVTAECERCQNLMSADAFRQAIDDEDDFEDFDDFEAEVEDWDY